ncbi:hypothetical protein MMC14_001099 [Varicellaria rhodocarpa]|nr:hypothetical protein [Varicellaria rhodocarpa]
MGSIQPESSNAASSNTSNQDAYYGARPTIILSPSKSAIYNRRAKKSPVRLPHFPTPQISQPLFHKSDDDDAPPSHEMDFDESNVFKALLNFPELVHNVAKYMTLDSLISLYAISKDFHILMNCRFTTMIKSQAELKAPESAEVFKFKCYRNLCIYDPARRQNEENESQIRFVPGFRWLRFIFFREKVVHEIMLLLANEGHRFPKGTSLVIKKIWFIMDISDAVRRIALVRNKDIWRDKELFLAAMFFIKLDMRFNDAVDGTGELGMRKMMFAQRSLGTLWRVLKREEMLNQLEMMRMFIRWKYKPLPQHRNMNLFGVQPRDIGRGEYEAWGYGSKKILRPDEIVIKESLTRGLSIHARILDMMIWGHVDKRGDLFKDVWPVNIQVDKTDKEDENKEEELEDSDDESMTFDFSAFSLD